MAPFTVASTAQELMRGLREVLYLRRRIAELDAEIRECRRLNRRLADVTDLAAELLIPVCNRDDDRLRRLMLRAQAAR